MNILIYSFVFFIGISIGSFLNCLIWRLHREEKITGRSYCPNCKKKISWHDNIPVVSFIFLGGKCRKCKKNISWQYPVVELLTGLLFVFVLYFINYELRITNYKMFIEIFRDWFLVSVMVVIFIIDLRWYLILDIVTLPACLITFTLNLLLGFSLSNLLLSGIIGGSFFLIQFIVSKGRWIGGGDLRLGLLMGLALGHPMVLVAIFLAYITGSIIALALLASGKKKWSSEIPLGVFLSLATVITMFWGERLLGWYLGLI